MFKPQVRAESVDAAVGGRAVGAGRALRGVRVVVVPAVGDLLAARLAAPKRGALGGRHKHAVVRVLRHRHVGTLCKQRPVHFTPNSIRYYTVRNFTKIIVVIFLS